jgi:hypothetical protein
MANKNTTQGEWYVNINNRHDVYVKDGYRIAEVWSGEMSFDRSDVLKQEANAELIALAGNLAQKYNLEKADNLVYEVNRALYILQMKETSKNPKEAIKEVSEIIGKALNDFL